MKIPVMDAGSPRRISVRTGPRVAVRPSRRQAYLDALRRDFELGLIAVDTDDPRTTVGLTGAEVRYIRGEHVSDNSHFRTAKGGR